MFTISLIPPFFFEKASFKGHPEACQLLVDRGADREMTNKNWERALDLAKIKAVQIIVAPPQGDEEYENEDEDSD